jgi:hypothetical protein
MEGLLSMFRTLRTLLAAALIALGGLTAASATAQTTAPPPAK